MFQQYTKGLMLGVLAAIAMSTTPAHAQVSTATATSSEAAGMRYLGGSADNDVRITLSASASLFTIDDVVPITIGPGCDPVASDPTTAKCHAPKSGNQFKGFVVTLADGRDTVVNATSTSTITGVPMQAHGGRGDDVLIGDATADDLLSGSNDNDELRDAGGDNRLTGGAGTDKLFGGAGTDELDGGSADDLLTGGPGRDLIDGGPTGISSTERHDRVDYSERTGAVTVILSRADASQGEQANPNLGIPAEGDTIHDVEDVTGGDGNDLLIGNAVNNNLAGGEGNDTLAGYEGLDILFGNDGSDTIFPSPPPAIAFPFGAVPDGKGDLVDCSNLGSDGPNPGDQAFRVVSDGDIVNDCTITDQ